MALQHLRSSTADKRPTPAAMSDGQLALNTNLASPGLFFKDSNGDSVKIGPVHIGTTAPNATPGAGGQAGNSKGEAWLDTSAANPILKVFNGSAFVAVQPVGTGTVVSTTDTGTVTSTMILDGTILNADINASAAIVDTKLDTIATAGKVSNSATTATSANTNSAIVARDASGNFTAGTVTANLIDASGITTSGLNGGPLAGFRNRIINGNFDFWQRGTSHSTSGYGSADRWDNTIIGSACTMSRQPFTLGQTDVPGEPLYFCRMAVTSVAGAGNIANLQQRIEGVRTFAGQQVTVSFWAKADAAKPISVELIQSFGSGGSPSASVDTIGTTKTTLSTSWQKVTVTATVPSISGKTLGTNGNSWLQLNIWFDAGSNLNARTDSLGQQSGTFDIAQVQIEPGPVATPFEQRPIGTELALCQRYYETGTGKMAGYSPASAANANAVYFKATKRAVPTLGYGVGSAVNVAVYDIRNADVSGAEWYAETVSLTSFVWTGPWTASAEL